MFQVGRKGQGMCVVWVNQSGEIQPETGRWMGIAIVIRVDINIPVEKDI